MMKFLTIITTSSFFLGLITLFLAINTIYENHYPANLKDDDSSSKKVPIKYFLNKDSLAINPSYSYQISDFEKPSRIRFTQSHINRDMDSCILYLDNDGFVVNEDGKKVYQGTNFGYGELFLILAEPFNHVMDPFAEKKHGSVIFAPRPLETSDNIGHYLAITSKDPLGNEFMIMLSGFEPYETVQFESRSCHEKVYNTITMSADGGVEIIYDPGVIDETEGPFRVYFYNETTNLVLQHYWGKIAFMPPPKYHELKNRFPDFFKN